MPKEKMKKTSQSMAEEDDIKEDDELLEEVHFEIDKNAFKGPFTCCGRKTKKVTKKRLMLAWALLTGHGNAQNVGRNT